MRLTQLDLHFRMVRCLLTSGVAAVLRLLTTQCLLVYFHVGEFYSGTVFIVVFKGFGCLRVISGLLTTQYLLVYFHVGEFEKGTFFIHSI